MSDNLLKSFVLVLRQSQGDAGVQCVDCLPLADDIEVLISDRDEYEIAWMTAEGKLADVEAERDRLREALLCGRRLWAIAQDDRVRLLIQLEQCERRHDA